MIPNLWTHTMLSRLSGKNASVAFGNSRQDFKKPLPHFNSSFFFNIILRLDKYYIQFLPSVSTGSSVSVSFLAFTSLPSFHFLIVRLQCSCSAFLPWWVFCSSAPCRRLLTSSRNFLFPLTHPSIVTLTHKAAAVFCCEWWGLITPWCDTCAY